MFCPRWGFGEEALPFSMSSELLSILFAVAGFSAQVLLPQSVCDSLELVQLILTLL